MKLQKRQWMIESWKIFFDAKHQNCTANKNTFQIFAICSHIKGKALSVSKNCLENGQVIK
ncbi:hypothetical protein [Endozoicomonas sp.]|uniref:hypothetical protein n=1 Tax=Endozoicomonas sp. TaxID=1892382 RepID=UPI003AF84A01